MRPRHVRVVPHTHWDREWYEPFQTFRYRLVQMIDSLLDLAESDPSYSHFLLDGQMAVVDDYLEVRPEAEERLRTLGAADRLTVGPWYILMDEFLVSGETIVRNLQTGIARAGAFGGAMDIGYLPDMFGHVAQMPQILALAGIEHAVVWRGVPSAITATGFFWEAPDGSRVRAEYLPTGYGSAAVLPDDPDALVRRALDYEKEVSSFLVGDMLWMNGSDHQFPQTHLGPVLRAANDRQDRFVFEITSLPAYLHGAPVEGLSTWRGELRSGARANMLMGVTSNRVDVKKAAALAERALERRAEPYAALYGTPAAWPAHLFDIAWKGMLHNAAHDSICACSVDEVVDAVLHRFAESRQIADGIATGALGELARSMREAGPVVVNPTPRPRGGVVELVVAADDPPTPDVQVLASTTFGLPGTLALDASTVRTILGMIQGTRIGDAWIHDVRVEEDDTGIDLTVTLGAEETPEDAIAEAKQDLYTRLGARPDVSVRVQLDQPPIRRIAARVSEVPGFGWAAFTPAPLAAPAHASRTEDGTVTLSTGDLTVVVDPASGTFAVDGVGSMGRLVDGGDLGDSYNYSPPARDSIVDTPVSVTTAVTESGPVRARATVRSVYEWPDHVAGATQERVGSHHVVVTTELEVRADERSVRVSTSFVNPARDHRLRVHLPLPTPTTTSLAECAFAEVTRGLEAEGRPEERGLPTFPARRFVAAGGLTVVADSVVEYELVDPTDGNPPGACTLALTVVRATGMLSRLGMAYRPLPAGPLTPVDGLQMVGRPVKLRYALALGEVDPWAFADDVVLPVEVLGSFGGGWRSARGTALSVSGAEVSSVRRVAGELEVRVFNPHPEPATVAVSLPDPAGTGAPKMWIVDLRGLPVAQVAGGSFPLRPFGIATVRVVGAREP